VQQTESDHDGATSDRTAALVADVREGLGSRPWTLPPKWLYDARGSELFDRITRLPEYYPTEAEREVLVARADEVVAACGADTLVELGSGSSDKTTALLDAMRDAGHLRRYVGFDVSRDALQGAARDLRRRYPGLEVELVEGDFDHDLHRIPHHGHQLVAFLGGTIGNYEPGARGRFLVDVAATLGPDDAFLLGTDLVKDEARLVAAYDDAHGVTAAFNRNVLEVLRRELGAELDPEGWEHRAVWDADNEWVEMRLLATRDQVVRIPAADLELHVEAGEHVRTEVSAKFRPERIDAELAAAGMRTSARWADARGDYAVTLAVRTP